METLALFLVVMEKRDNIYSIQGRAKGVKGDSSL